MILLEATQNRLVVTHKELLTEGTVNVTQVHIDFSADWDDLAKTAVFECAGKSISMVLDDTNACYIPWEVLACAHRSLRVGVYGTKGTDVVLPTIWASLGTVMEGTKLGDDARQPTPDIFQQITALMGDLDDLETADKSSLVAAINEARQTGEGGGIGFSPDGKTLMLKDGVLSVNTAEAAEKDNTLPITSAAVYTEVGNINVLLQTI